MIKLRDAARQALAIFEREAGTRWVGNDEMATLLALREALAQPQGEWVDLLAALESVWLWMENQADGQSKGGHATFDLMMLREQRDIAHAAIAKFKNKNTPPVVPQGEPVAWVNVIDSDDGPYDFHGIEKLPKGKALLYATPVRTKDLTDYELDIFVSEKTMDMRMTLREFARAVIAADREKNK